MLQLFASKLGSKSQQKAQNKKLLFIFCYSKNKAHNMYIFFYITIVFKVNSQKIFKNSWKLPAAAPPLYNFTIVHTHHVPASFSYGHPHEILQRHFPNFFSENELSSAFPKKFYSMIKKLKTKKGTIFSRQKFWTLVCPTTWCWHVVRLLMRFTDWDHWQPKFSLLWM